MYAHRYVCVCVYIYIYIYGGTGTTVVTIIGNGHSRPISNPGQCYLHFTKYYYPW